MLADARPRWGYCSPTRGRGVRQPLTTIDGRCRAPEGAPHVLSANAGSVAVSRNRRGSPSLRVPATSNCRDGGVLRGWDTTTAARRLATPPWPRRAGVWTGCPVGRSLRSRVDAELKRLPRTSCRRSPQRQWYRGIVAESSPRSGPRRRPAIVQAWFRPTRHPVQTPARRGHGGVASRRAAVVVSQPRSTPPSLQLDVAGTLAKGCLDDSAIPLLIRRSPKERAGHPRALCTVRRSW